MKLVVSEPARHNPTAIKVTEQEIRNTGRVIEGKANAAILAQKMPTETAMIIDKLFMPTLYIMKFRASWVDWYL